MSDFRISVFIVPCAGIDAARSERRALPCGSWKDSASVSLRGIATFTRGRLLLRVAVSFIFAALLFAGCARSEPEADLVIINGAEPESIDPAIITGQADGRVGLALFEGLTRFNPTNAAPIPGLAERWNISGTEKFIFFNCQPMRSGQTAEPLPLTTSVISCDACLIPRPAA